MCLNLTATPWDRYYYFPHFPDGENWDPEWCRNTARKWQVGAEPRLFNHYFNLLLSSRLWQIWNICFWDANRTYCPSEKDVEPCLLWMFVCLNQVMQTSCGSLPMGSLSRGGAGIALIKPHYGRPWDAQFILWHDIPFLTLSPEIRRFDFFCTFIQNLWVTQHFKIVFSHLMFSECYSGFKCGIRTCQMLLIGHKSQRDLSDFLEFTGSCKFLASRGWARTQLG